MHPCSEYALVDLWIPSVTLQGETVLAKLRREIHLVDTLRANVLVGMDVIGTEGLVIDVPARRSTIRSCQDVTFPIDVKKRTGKPVKRTVLSASEISLPPTSVTAVGVRFGDALPPDRDFIFEGETVGEQTGLLTGCA